MDKALKFSLIILVAFSLSACKTTSAALCGVLPITLEKGEARQLSTTTKQKILTANEAAKGIC